MSDFASKPAAPLSESRSETRSALRRVGGALGPLLALVVVFASFALAEYAIRGEMRFAGALNLRNMLVKTAVVAVASLGMTTIIIAGGIDLSAGTALALSATVLAWCLREGWPVAGALAAGVGTGVAAGLVNGALVAMLRVVPFIITLGTMSAYVGLAKIIGDETTVRPQPDQIPHWLSELLAARPDPEWLVLPLGVWGLLVLALTLSAVLRYTVFGRHVFAIGSNEATARLCGVNVPLTKIAVYTLAGLFVGLAGIYQFSRLSSGNPTSGSGLELKIIAAVVIGGGSLSGGRGMVLGTLAGAGLMGVIASGCTQLGIRDPVQDIIIGAIIVVAVALDQWRQRHLAS